MSDQAKKVINELGVPTEKQLGFIKKLIGEPLYLTLEVQFINMSRLDVSNLIDKLLLIQKQPRQYPITRKPATSCSGDLGCWATSYKGCDEPSPKRKSKYRNHSGDYYDSDYELNDILPFGLST